jgi:hypothetical protein
MFAVVNKEDNLCGAIMRDENANTYSLSNIAQHILKVERDTYNLESLQDILDSIQMVINRVAFSSKYVGTDEFTNHPYDDDKIISSIIKGCYTFLIRPAGIVLYHENNQILFDCLQIQYMIDKKSIPNIYTSLDLSNMYKIGRSDGSQHNSIFLKTESLRYSKSQENSLVVTLHFYMDKSDPITSDYGFIEPEYYKGLGFAYFLELNKIKQFIVKIPYINLDNYDELIIERELAETLAKYYNNKIDEYMQSIKETMMHIGNVEVNGNELVLNI